MCGYDGEGWPTTIPPVCECGEVKLWNMFMATDSWRLFGWVCTTCDLVTVE